MGGGLLNLTGLFSYFSYWGNRSGSGETLFPNCLTVNNNNYEL